MKSIAIVLGLLFSISGYAATDRQCVSDCRDKGYKRDLCNEQCSYGNDSSSGHLDTDMYYRQTPIETNKSIDPKCQTECIVEGYQTGFCNNRCSY